MLSPKLICTDKHPTSIKFEKLCTFAEELGISFYWDGHHVIIKDRDRDPDLPKIHLHDIEEHHWINSFPPKTEYKLIHDNPEYLKQQEIERQIYEAKLAEKEKLRKEAEAKLKLEQEAKELAIKESKEKQLLAELKAKYEQQV